MKVFKFDHNDEMFKKEYCRVYGLLARILRPDLSIEERKELVL